MQNQTGHSMVVCSSDPALIPLKSLNMILSSSSMNGIYYY
jgi:hypothetical protein